MASASQALAAMKSNSDSVNEIIVKIEMKKFQNLVNNRLQRKNNLVASDIGRVFPLNKIVDGSAKVAQAPTSFKEGLMKFKPKLFPLYENHNKKQNGQSTIVSSVHSSSPVNRNNQKSRLQKESKDYSPDIRDQFNSTIDNRKNSIVKS